MPILFSIAILYTNFKIPSLKCCVSLTGRKTRLILKGNHVKLKSRAQNTSFYLYRKYTRECDFGLEHTKCHWRRDNYACM